MSGQRILVGDCREVMRALAPASFDLIVTSPPYDAEKAYEGARDFAAYTEFARSWLAEAPRLMTPRASLWINLGYTKLGANEALPLTYLYYAIKPPALRLVQEIVWHYEGGMAYKRRFAHRTERWMWFALDPCAAYFDLDAVRDRSLNRTSSPRNHPMGKNPTDCWYFDRVAHGAAERTAHPCQFPVAMVRRIVRACCPAGGTILDPFVGSGSTLVAAAAEGRAAVGIERDPAYAGIAAARTRIAA